MHWSLLDRNLAAFLASVQLQFSLTCVLRSEEREHVARLSILVVLLEQTISLSDQADFNTFLDRPNGLFLFVNLRRSGRDFDFHSQMRISRRAMFARSYKVEMFRVSRFGRGQL